MIRTVPKDCVVFGDLNAKTVLIQPADANDRIGLEAEASILKKQTKEPFCLFALFVEDWNRELSPWPAPSVFGTEPFSGEAEKTLDRICKEILSPLKDSEVFLGGYSLAGLFALWAAYKTDVFDGVCAASPSVWYPNWIDYVSGRSPKAGRIYLSLGDREERTKNSAMACVGERIRQQHALLNIQKIETVLEWNQGNHFVNVPERTAKGFAWLINKAQSTEPDKGRK
jgi:hypothetical protein